MRWTGYVARMGEKIGTYRVLVGKPEGKRHLEDPGVDGRIILKGSARSGMEVWTGLIWFRVRRGGGLSPMR